MLRRNVDFFAMIFIGFGLLASSRLPAIGTPRLTQPVHFQTAMASDPCPISSEVFSRLASLFDN